MATVQRVTTPALTRTMFGFKRNSAGKEIAFGPLDFQCKAKTSNTIFWPPDPSLAGSKMNEFGGNQFGVLLPMSTVHSGGLIKEPYALVQPDDDPSNLGLADLTGKVAPSMNVGDAITIAHDGGLISGTISGPLAQYPAGDPGSSVRAYKLSLSAPAGIIVSGAIVLAGSSVVGMFWVVQPGTAGVCIPIEDIDVH